MVADPVMPSPLSCPGAAVEDNATRKLRAKRGLPIRHARGSYDVRYWSKKFKITPAKLKAAVAPAGHSSKEVEAYLKRQKAAKKGAKKKRRRREVTRAAFADADVRSAPAYARWASATSPSSLSFHSSFAGHAPACSLRVAAPRVARRAKRGGHDRDRTCDPYHVKVVLSR